MATLQSKIPFKSRKKTSYIKNTKNKDSCIISEVNSVTSRTRSGRLKRQKYDSISDDGKIMIFTHDS